MKHTPKFCLLIMFLVGLGSVSVANATVCGDLDGVTCCADVFTLPGNNCCSAYACADGTGGGSCSACLLAKTVDSQHDDSEVVALAGVEHIKVNNTVLDLQFS